MNDRRRAWRADLLVLAALAVGAARAQVVSSGPTIISSQGDAQSHAVTPGETLPPSAEPAAPPPAVAPTAVAVPTAPAAPAAAPRPAHVEMTDSNNAPGTIVAGRGGQPVAAEDGAGVILDKSGKRLEVLPPGAEPVSTPPAPVVVITPPSAPQSGADVPRAPLSRGTLTGLLAGAVLAAALFLRSRRG